MPSDPVDLVQVLEPYLRSLHAAVADLSRPLALERIAAVVCDAAMEALDAQALVIAVHDNGGSSLRGVHATGLPDDVRDRICMRSAAAPELVGEIDRFLRSSGPGPASRRGAADLPGRARPRSPRPRPARRPAVLRRRSLVPRRADGPLRARSGSAAPVRRPCTGARPAQRPDRREQGVLPASGRRPGDRPRGAEDHDRQPHSHAHTVRVAHAHLPGGAARATTQPARDPAAPLARRARRRRARVRRARLQPAPEDRGGPLPPQAPGDVRGLGYALAAP